jgi:hypothetical protein
MRLIWKRRARTHLLLAAVACLALVGAGEAGAAKTIAVDCTANPNALAGAILNAKKGDTLSITGTCNGTYEIAKNLTLVGTGDGSRLDAQGLGTVLTVDSGISVDVSNLTIEDGYSTAPLPDIAIGGIHNLGTLSLTKSSVIENTAGVGAAFFAIGGIYNDGGTLALSQSSVNSNAGSVDSGLAFGGILNEGAMTITGSSVTGNSATASGSSGTRVARAGIENGGTLTIVRSTVAGNTATGASSASGGIVNVPTGTLTLTSSIVVLNNATAVGGAVGGLANVGGQVTISGSRTETSSVSSNGAQSTNGPAVGGISNRPDQGTGGSMRITNGIVTENSANAPAGTMAGGISNQAPATLTLGINTTVRSNHPCDQGSPFCA